MSYEGSSCDVMENDGTGLQHDFQYNSSDARQPVPLIPSSWLNVRNVISKSESKLMRSQGKESWPQRLEQTLETFMRDHQWHSYKKKEDDSDRNMEAVLSQLQQFFDFEEWDQSHKEKLKKKVRNKMYRLNSSDSLTKFRNALKELPNESHHEAVRNMAEMFGAETVSAVLKEVYGINMMDLIDWNGST